MTNQNRFGCLSAALFLVLCVSLFVNFVLMARRVAQPASANTMREEVAVPPQSGEMGSDQKIALITLRGIITSSEIGNAGETMADELKLQLRQATRDPKVKAIVFYVDSPGGEVTASDTIYQALRAAREKKPVVVYMGSLAASGGYYIACAGSHLIASETTLTGSIGVIMQSIRYKELIDKIGVGVLTFKSGKFKDMLSGSRDLSDEEVAYVQALVMQTYDKFVGIVAKERKVDEKVLREGIADGRVLSGKDALANKLIDATGTVEDAYAKAMDLGGARGAAVIKYEASFKLGRVLRMLSETPVKSAKVEVNLGDSLLPKLEAGRLYYLPSFLVP